MTRLEYQRILQQNLSDDRANLEYYEKKYREAKAKFEATQRAMGIEECKHIKVELVNPITGDPLNRILRCTTCKKEAIEELWRL